VRLVGLDRHPALNGSVGVVISTMGDRIKVDLDGTTTRVNVKRDNLAEADDNLAEADANLAEADANLAEADDNLAEVDANLAEADANLAEADDNLAEADATDASAEVLPAAAPPAGPPAAPPPPLPVQQEQLQEPPPAVQRFASPASPAQLRELGQDPRAWFAAVDENHSGMLTYDQLVRALVRTNPRLNLQGATQALAQLDLVPDWAASEGARGWVDLIDLPRFLEINEALLGLAAQQEDQSLETVMAMLAAVRGDAHGISREMAATALWEENGIIGRAVNRLVGN